MDRLPFTRRLEAALATLGRPVGLGGPPKTPAGADVAPPYFVLYSLPGASHSGPWDDPHADVEWTYQVTIVGGRADQTELWTDRVWNLVMGRNVVRDDYDLDLDGPGQHVMARRPVAGTSDSEGATVSVAERYAFRVTPVRS